MSIFAFGRYTLSLSAVVAMLAGCEVSQAPVGTAGAMQQNRAGVTHADRSGSWMLPEAKSQDLLYVSDEGPNVLVLSYPGGNLLGVLRGFNGSVGECVDSSGDVWIADEVASEILEYAHGGTAPKATVPDRGYYPQGCAIDPVSGNLAVSNYTGFHGKGDLIIYHGARGKPERLTDPDFTQYYFCAYDDHGNLFVDGSGGGYNRYAVLRRGSKKLTTIALDQGLYVSGGVLFDGKYIVLGGWNGSEPVLYQTTGFKGRVVNSIDLLEGGGALTFWIEKSTVIAAGCCARGLSSWNYPQGGSPVGHIHGRFYPYYVVVSRRT